MKRRHDWLKKTVSVGVTTLLLGLSVAVPLMERADLSSGPVVEAEHEPGACHNAHDHSVCTLVGASATATGHDHAEPIELGALVARLPSHTSSVAASAFDEGHPSRAPPLA